MFRWVKYFQMYKIKLRLLKLWSVQFGTLIEKFEISDESNTVNI